jgi:hypothetical protein
MSELSGMAQELYTVHALASEGLLSRAERGILKGAWPRKPLPF